MKDKIFIDSYEYLLGEERVNNYLKNKVNNEYIEYLKTPFNIIFKTLLLSIMGLFGYIILKLKIHFSKLFKYVLLCQYILLIPIALKIVWFIWIENLVFIGDFYSFSPWSMSYYLKEISLPSIFINWGKAINFFYILFILSLSYYIQKSHSNISLKQSIYAVIIGYTPFYLIGMTFLTFVLKLYT
ncbi:hypothetical protein EI427_17460 [Flammeovirga pectinis]|uniref:Yip1 domain-containing protein n=1 Tax=Flammeovirga pectinis TaxID=2494373 RepID=A0A3S9P6U8_9BACT|nr:hypothetical protein [Flammeovirga pectinis]AZQ63947.1 hypothetical protein EI427_17460 [Flammeovirga pectinis]